jgi:hypothetical protein
MDKAAVGVVRVREEVRVGLTAATHSSSRAGSSLTLILSEAGRSPASEDRRAEIGPQLDDRRAQDLTLQAHFDQMSTLMLLEDLEDPKARTVARAPTVLRRLAPSRKED